MLGQFLLKNIYHLLILLHKINCAKTDKVCITKSFKLAKENVALVIQLYHKAPIIQNKVDDVILPPKYQEPSNFNFSNVKVKAIKVAFTLS